MTSDKFDGRHRDHQKLSRTMMGLKARTGCSTTILTFGTTSGTAIVGQPQTAITTSLECRANMEKVGIDYLVEYPFIDETHHTELGAFVRDILAGRMHVKEVVIDPDCNFGYKGIGSTTLFLVMIRDLGYRSHVIEKEKGRRRDINNTYICGELEKGSARKANQLLDQLYAIHGKVAHGNHIGGSLLGFPTASILPSPIRRLPRYGVYVSRVLMDGVCYKGVTNIGKGPTVGGEYPAGVGTYIFGLEGDIYGKGIGVQVLAFSRPEQKSTPLEGLKERIEKDKEPADAYYKKCPEILMEK